MEYEGAFVDEEMLKNMSSDLSKKVEKLSTEIIKEAVVPAIIINLKY